MNFDRFSEFRDTHLDLTDEELDRRNEAEEQRAEHLMNDLLGDSEKIIMHPTENHD